ncbi:MAG: hypothetical protein ACRDTS_16260 [Mycobacterium sp.]
MIVAAADTAPVVTDAEGRRIALRRLSALDKLRLFKAAGPVLAQNQPWLGMAVLACSVTAIDDVPVPASATEQQIEAMVARLGDTGINAIAAALDAESTADSSETLAAAGN